VYEEHVECLRLLSFEKYVAVVRVCGDGCFDLSRYDVCPAIVIPCV
jgi:hypothetical protein